MPGQSHSYAVTVTWTGRRGQQSVTISTLVYQRPTSTTSTGT